MASRKLCLRVKDAGLGIDRDDNPYKCRLPAGHTGMHKCWCCEKKWRKSDVKKTRARK